MAQIKIRKYKEGGGTVNYKGDDYTQEQVKKAIDRIPEEYRKYVEDISTKVSAGNNFTANGSTLTGTYNNGLNARQQNRLGRERSGFGKMLDATTNNEVNMASNAVQMFLKNLELTKGNSSSSSSSGSASALSDLAPKKKLYKANGEKFFFGDAKEDGTYNPFDEKQASNAYLFGLLDDFNTYLSGGLDAGNNNYSTNLSDAEKDKLFKWYAATGGQGIDDLKNRIRALTGPISDEDSDLVDTLSMFGISPTDTKAEREARAAEQKRKEEEAYKERVANSVYGNNDQDFWNFFKLENDGSLSITDGNGLRRFLGLGSNQGAVFNGQFEQLHPGWYGLNGKWLIGNKLYDEADIKGSADGALGLSRNIFRDLMKKGSSKEADNLFRYNWSNLESPWRMFDSQSYYNPDFEEKMVTSGGQFTSGGKNYNIIKWYDPTDDSAYDEFGFVDANGGNYKTAVVDEFGNIVNVPIPNDYYIKDSDVDSIGYQYDNKGYIDLFGRFTPDQGAEYNYMYNPKNNRLKFISKDDRGNKKVHYIDASIFGNNINEIKDSLNEIIMNQDAHRKLFRLLERNRADKVRNKVMDKYNISMAEFKNGGILYAAAGDSFINARTRTGRGINNTIQGLDEGERVGLTQGYKEFGNKNSKWTAADSAQLAGIALDVGSVAAALAGASPAALASSLAGTGASFYADIKKDGFQWRDLGNLGINLGISAATLLPGIGSGTSAFKTVRAIKAAAPVILKGFQLFGIGSSAAHAIKKIANGEKWNMEDIRIAAGGITTLAHMAIARPNKGLSKKENIQEGKSLGKQDVKETKFNLDQNTFTPDEINAINAETTVAGKKAKITDILKNKKIGLTDQEISGMLTVDNNGKVNINLRDGIDMSGLVKGDIDTAVQEAYNNKTGSADEKKAAAIAELVSKLTGRQRTLYTDAEVKSKLGQAAVETTTTKDFGNKKLSSADVKAINAETTLDGKRAKMVELLTNKGVDKSSAESIADKAIVEAKSTSFKNKAKNLVRKKKNEIHDDESFINWADGYLQSRTQLKNRTGLNRYLADRFAYDRAVPTKYKGTQNRIYGNQTDPRWYNALTQQQINNFGALAPGMNAGVNAIKRHPIYQPYYYNPTLIDTYEDNEE